MASNQEPVVVVGLGRFGTAVARELVRRGTEVLGVDNRSAVVQRMAGQIGHVVEADSTDPDAMRDIGVGSFTRAVVAISTDQEASILTTAVLADLEIPHIWAKALSEQHAKILRRVGAHRVVLPEHDMGERVAHLVSGDILDYIEVDADWVLAKTLPPKYLVGVPLGQSRLRAKHHVTVVSVKPEGAANFTHADADTVLTYGDQILVAGRVSDLDKFVESI